jgi:tetratricopeptide (TPR) repeat protein
LGSLLLAVGAFAAAEVWSVWQERLARQALADDRREEARLHIERALWMHGNRVSTLLLAARIFRLRGSYAEAEEHLLRCGQLKGMNEPVQLEWLLLRCQKGEVDELSPNLFSLVKQHHPETPAILETLASVYMRQTRYLEAILCLNLWLEQHPDAVRALDWRGWVGNQLDHRDQTIHDYERLLELQPDRTDIRLRLAQALNDSARDPDAVVHLERLQKELPDNPEVLVGLARCRVNQRRMEEATALLDTVLKAHPDHFDALFQRGKLEINLGHAADAEPWLLKALQIKPHDTEALYSLYQSLQRQPSRQEEAERARLRWDKESKKQQQLTSLLRKYLAGNPNDVELACQAGELFMELDEGQRGLFWLQRALAKNPRHVASHRALLAYYERTGQSDKAEEERRQLMMLLSEPRR